MTTTAAQQVSLDNALVPLEKRVKISKCNMRIDPKRAQKEPTYQVVCSRDLYATILVHRQQGDDEEETKDDEYVHTLKDYVPTDDETNDESKEFNEEEYEELYGDVNIRLTDAEPTDKEKDGEEMTVTGYMNVNQEGAGNQVKDDAQATQKTEAPIPSSSILSDYTAKYLNFDNIPPVDTKVVSMLDINVQHKVPQATTSTTDVPDSETFSAFHQRITNLEKDVKELKTVDHSASLLSTIKYEVPNAVKEYLGTSLDDALHKVLQKHSADIVKEHYVPVEIIEKLGQKYVLKKSTKDIIKIKMEHARKQQVPKVTITSFDTTALEEFDQKTTLFETMTKSKSLNKSPKQRALYHALMELILEDEEAMDEGVANKLKKRKQDDVCRNQIITSLHNDEQENKLGDDEKNCRERK
ncbi:hypothetical protein Tco_0778950 [Tanacetum coccineum]